MFEGGELMVERPKDEKNIECALCAPFEQTGTWRCAECGAMNINKWKECWKCKSPRVAEVVVDRPGTEPK